MGILFCVFWARFSSDCGGSVTSVRQGSKGFLKCVFERLFLEMLDLPLALILLPPLWSAFCLGHVRIVYAELL